MSIYFTQVISIFLGFIVFASLNDNAKGVKVVFLPSLFGIILGILLFKFAKFILIDSVLKLVFDCFTLLCLLVGFFLIFFEIRLAKIINFFLLGIGYGFFYSSFSMLFPLFSGELLDTISVISLFLMVFAMLLCVVLFFFISSVKDEISPKIVKLLAVTSLFALVFERLFVCLLELMRAGIIQTHPMVLSVVAKGIYIGSFATYFHIAFAFFVCFFVFLKRESVEDKNLVGAIIYRFRLAKRIKTTQNFKFSSTILLISLSFMLYYDLYASRPPTISTPIIVEPKDGKFIFDAQVLKDNKLHRYAYITDEGKEVRFFLLNKFSDRISPVAVFDACMICGDMGYVKKGDELICISCNVRIFLPSVGKEGGCNPIPLEFKYDGKDVIIELETIENGANHFSKVVEKMVLDPVSRKKVSNLESKSYIYYGRRYFFENGQNYAKFEAEPEKYVDINGSLK